MNVREVAVRRMSPLATPTGLSSEATCDIAGALNGLLAGGSALCMKTKNFHWHMSGPHFGDYRRFLGEQVGQRYAMTDASAERVRKLGGTTLRSVGHIGRVQRILDNDADDVEPLDMLPELRSDKEQLAAEMRESHGVCDQHGDAASASLLENWIDEAEQRVWFLFEAGRRDDVPVRCLAERTGAVGPV
jgi:starvation-inducible DNA-binding protein